MTRRKRRFFTGDIACLFAAALFVQAAAAEAATAGPPDPEIDRLCGFLHNFEVLKADLRDRNKLERIPVGLNPIVVSSAFIDSPAKSAPREPETPPRLIGIIVDNGPALSLGSHGADPIQTVEVVSVVLDMPAAEAGVEPGDLIISIDGEPPGESRTVGERVRALAEGESVRLVVLRERRTLVFDIEPAEEPDNLRLWSKDSDSRADAFETSRMLGIIVGDGPAIILGSHEFRPIQTVEVTAVMLDTPAAEAGVEPGDLIISIEGEPPGHFSAVGERVRSLAEGESVRLIILRQQRILVFDITPADTPEDIRFWRSDSDSRADAFEDVLAAFSGLYTDIWAESDDFKTETIASSIEALTQVRTAAAMLYLLDALPPERAKASREAILEEATARLHEAGARLGIMAHDPAIPPAKRRNIERARDRITIFRRLADVDPKQVDRRRHWRTRQLIDSFIYDMRDADAFTVTVAGGLREPEPLDRAEFGSEQHHHDFFQALHEEWLGMQWQEAELWRRLVDGDPADPDPSDPDPSDPNHD
ncbi:MAG: PDZ domain-containing protein [Phycisphaerales bacterium]|nr:PDZ domain-containing protein [Phycisphaerales bacterium]